MEKILDITRFTTEGKKEKRKGYKVITNEQMIYVTIENRDECGCELIDEIDKFIGSELFEIRVNIITDGKNDRVLITDSDKKLIPNIASIVMTTNAGILRFLLHNYHDGRHGCGIMVDSDKFNYYTIL